VRYTHQDSEFDFGPEDEGNVSLSSGLIFRNRWGIVRANVSYQEDL
jgi:hypothetical protein